MTEVINVFTELKAESCFSVDFYWLKAFLQPKASPPGGILLIRPVLAVECQCYIHPVFM